MNKSDALARFEAFTNLGGEARTMLTAAVIIRMALRAEAILHRGQPVSGAYLVLKGRLRVFTVAPNGIEATLYFIDPGETCVLAIDCLFNNLLYPAWVQAEMPSDIAVVPGPVYRKLFETERGIQNLTVRALSAAMAGHLGTTREGIARLIGDFVAHGFLTSRRGLICIQDSAGLRQVFPV